jgi:hypothetical protein
MNINEYVEFILTEEGARVYNARWDGLKMPTSYVPSTKQAGERIRMQLWNVMEVFGPHTGLGLRTFCESGEIEILSKSNMGA